MKQADKKTEITRPKFRKIRAYAFDPSLSLQLDNALINNITYKVTWEDKLLPGPIGEYVEVVDYDPTCESYYKPVDLDDRFILAQDGLDPNEANPMFHQQMVYAVAMTTIINFEKALGRKIFWNPHTTENNKIEFLRRLRLYPHGLREANAYYTPQKKAILFGYFSSLPDSPGIMLPGATVYTCLSHDIIAHEVTHALLDGMHRRYVESAHPDSLAFHEAFADLVALFQHFTFSDVLKSQIARTRGDLQTENLLGELAQEFGKAIGNYGSLRNALGGINPRTEKWEPKKADSSEYVRIKEPHERGSILVATIFDAFINIYRRRIADLQRLATGGSGILRQGAIHPDLVNRMANEAAKTAGHFLNICIRALDYCPPMDINFGDYLRAMITADYDLVDSDDWDYRVALIEAFQKRGIYPDGVKNMSVDSLLLRADYNENNSEDFDSKFGTLIEFFKLFKEKAGYLTDRKEIFELTRTFIRGGAIDSLRFEDFSKKPSPKKIMGLHELLLRNIDNRQDFERLTGIILSPENLNQKGIGISLNEKTQNLPLVEIHNLKIVSRVGPQGKLVNQIILTLNQRRGVIGTHDEYGNVDIKGYFVPDDEAAGSYEKQPDGSWAVVPPNPSLQNPDVGRVKVLPDGWFIFRGGCTMIFDLNYADSNDNVKLKYIIRKKIQDEDRMKNQYKTTFLKQEQSLNATYFGSTNLNLEAEPFAIIHALL